MSEKITGLKGSRIVDDVNQAKSSFVSGTLGPLQYAEKAIGTMPPEKTLKEINKANRPYSRDYAPGVIQHPSTRPQGGAENLPKNSSGKNDSVSGNARVGVHET